jgi:predicted HAD superfamily Cof-like phosphohydrolase
MTTLEQVKELHEKFGQPIEDKPFTNSSTINSLRIRLIDEECEELDHALVDRDNVEVLDALCDLQVVLDGAFLALGFWRVKDEAMAEVHRSNMSKLGTDGKPVLREDGKFLKGPNYSPPNLKPIVEKLYVTQNT